jgi:hypothetical protein
MPDNLGQMRLNLCVADQSLIVLGLQIMNQTGLKRRLIEIAFFKAKGKRFQPVVEMF